MNSVKYAIWLQAEGLHVTFLCVEDSPIHKEILNSDVKVLLVKRNRKYFDFVNALRVSKQLKSIGCEIVLYRDTRDMSLLASVKLFFPKVKLLYWQAMQLGIDKKDFLHTLRFRSINVWVSTLNFLKQQVVRRTNYPSNRLRVVPLGVDNEKFESLKKSKSNARQLLNISSDVFLCGVIGRIDPLKGQHIAINALQQIKQDKIHLIILGESTKNEGNQYELDLKKKVRSLNLENRVHFRPYSKDVATFYSALDCFILTSKGETFGTVTIEAMSFGLPIIGTNSSGTPELLNNGECGILFEPDNSEALANAIIELNSDSTKAKELASKAKLRFLEHYSKASSVRSLIQVINEA